MSAKANRGLRDGTVDIAAHLKALETHVAALRRLVAERPKTEESVLAADTLGIMAVQIDWFRAALRGVVGNKVAGKEDKKGHGR